MALVLRYNKEGKQTRSYAYISTGNFNEKTARIYADSGLFTSNEIIVNDLYTLFRVLQKEVTEPKFKRLLVARFNLLPELRRRIGYEINMAKAGKEARIILKMNALQDPAMIDELYKASEAGVKIDLIVRGICCLIPNQPYSRNIRITRIVDSFWNMPGCGISTMEETASVHGFAGLDEAQPVPAYRGRYPHS